MKVNKAILRPIVLGVSQLLPLALPASTWGQLVLCGVKKGCAVAAQVGPGLLTGPPPGSALSFGVQGQGLAIVDMDTLAWRSSDMTGSSPVLGKISLSLNAAIPSSGVLTHEGDQDSFTNTNSFFWRISTSNAGVLVSNDPVVIQATGINSIPPTATYRKIGGNVDFYVEGDPQQTTVFTMQSATVDVRPPPGAPAVSEWGLGVLALLLLSGVALKFGRRRTLAG